MIILDEQYVMVNTKTHDPIAEKCVRLVAERLGVRVRIQDAPAADRADYDYRIAIETRPPVHVLGLVRKHRRLVHEQVRHVALAARLLRTRYRKPVLFLAPWIEETWAEELRAAGVFYADLQGNAFVRLEKPLVQLEVAGRRPPAPPRAEPGRLIEVSGLKVLHLLLTQPDAIRRPYRRLAQEAGVALGTVGVVMRELRLAGHLRKVGPDEWDLHQRPALVELFVRGYALKLRPTCLIGRYRHQDHDVGRLRETLLGRLARQRVRYTVTGGTAAEILTGYLRPDVLTLFVEDAGIAALKDERMLPEPVHGQVILLKQFWPAAAAIEKADDRKLATPLLVYAELLQDGRPRELETARDLYDRVMAAHG